MYVKTNNNSCFFIALIIFLVVFAILIKYWQIILLVFLVIYLYNKFSTREDYIDLTKETKEFESKKGVVYKVCPNCGAKADRKAKKCLKCGYEFE